MPSTCRLALLLLVSLLTFNSNAIADESGIDIQQAFNERYHEFLAVGSQTPLPFPRIGKEEWKKLFASKEFKLIFTEPNKFYNNKTYTFKLYQAADDNVYYLDAIGGFWGMEELVYRPIIERDLIKP